MSVILPKRNQIEKIYPTNANATARVTGTSGSYSAYTQVVAAASMNADFILTGMYVNQVFTESSASFSGKIPWQLKVAIGAAASEVDIDGSGSAMGVQYTHNASNAQLGVAVFCPLSWRMIASGTRIAVRSVTPATKAASLMVYLVGFEPSSGFPLPKPWEFGSQHIQSFLRGMKTNGGSLAPDGSFNSISSHASTTWTYGSTVEMIASASSDLLITGILASIQDTISTGTHANYEVGIGTSSNEEWFSAVGAPGLAGLPGPGGGLLQLARPLYVKVGERVACRMKSSPANKTVDCALVYTILK